MMALLSVNNLKTWFKTEDGLVKAVDGASFYINEREIVGLVGESGCGKSVSQLSILQLVRPPGKIVDGEVIFNNKDLLKFESKGTEMRHIRGGQISMIFQEPMTSLNPVLTISRQLTEMLELHLKMDKQSAKKRAIELLRLVKIPDADTRINDYPHQFSGGMRQRTMIAMAISCNPKLVIADEPTTSVDVTTQAQLLELMAIMVRDSNTSLLLITHNLGVVARYANRIYIMYAGRIVESGTSEQIFGDPCHPYTICLLRSVPRLDRAKEQYLIPIDGMPPNLINMPSTCAFLPRCLYHTDKCMQEPRPEFRQINSEHFVSCHVDIKGTL
ncbi:MAG: ABC transporter ATP-binding protein [Chloroflexi bacterium]|nr:ABC transporter ATP-binding protein [Chloroflexota bacterium]